MAEHILGMGTKKSVREMVSLWNEILGKVEGFPKRIHAKARGMTLRAEREDYEGPFTQFTIRCESVCPDLDDLKQSLQDYSDACTLNEEEEAFVIEAPGDKEVEDQKRVFAVTEVFSGKLALPEIWRVHGEDYRSEPVSPELLFLAMLQYKASDVHLSPGSPPVFRVDNTIKGSELTPPLSAMQILELIESITTEGEWKEFRESFQTSFNYHQVGLGYSRVSAFVKGGAPHITFRFLPEIIPSFEELHVPSDTMKRLANLHRGLLLVTGMTGSGKSTTVAALTDWINTTKSLHILTIENPVEYVHHNKHSVISQRTTGKDVLSFGDAVTGALRHDPDVIVIGEMRDPDTIRAAINAAATGHLVISTLHANNASEVVNRIVSFFDPVERDLVKLQLRDCLQCVICQRLVPKVGGGRVPALEMMFGDIKPIRDAIAEGDTDAMRIGIQQSVSHSFLFETYLAQLYKDGTVTLEAAQEFASDQSCLDQMILGTYSIPRLESIKTARADGSH